MSNRDNDFMVTGVPEDFSAVNHNESDYGKFHDFARKLDQRYAGFAEGRSQQERRKALKMWDDQQVAPWNQARLGKLLDQKAANETAEIIEKRGWGSFFITGGAGSGKTFLGMAVARRYIGGGLLLPSQVKHLSEGRLLTHLRGGFKGQEIVNEAFSSKYKLYILDNVSENAAYDPKEQSVWEMLLDHVSLNGLAIVFTSSSSLAGFAEKLSGPAQAKLAHLVNNRVITMNNVVGAPDIGELTEGEIKTSQRDEAIRRPVSGFRSSAKASKIHREAKQGEYLKKHQN